MKLSRTAGYALLGLAHLARQPAGQPIRAEDIAEAEEVPRFFLRNCLKALAHARILHSLPGPQGGFRLARPVQDITLLEVVEAVDGPLHGPVPELREGHDNAEGRKMERQLQSLCDEATRIEREMLAGVSVADLVEQSKKPGRRKKGE